MPVLCEMLTISMCVQYKPHDCRRNLSSFNGMTNKVNETMLLYDEIFCRLSRKLLSLEIFGNLFVNA